MCAPSSGANREAAQYRKPDQSRQIYRSRLTFFGRNSLSHENSRLRDDAGAIVGGTKRSIRLEQLGKLREEGDISVGTVLQCQLDLLSEAKLESIVFKTEKEPVQRHLQLVYELGNLCWLQSDLAGFVLGDLSSVDP